MPTHFASGRNGGYAAWPARAFPRFKRRFYCRKYSCEICTLLLGGHSGWAQLRSGTTAVAVHGHLHKRNALRPPRRMRHCLGDSNHKNGSVHAPGPPFAACAVSGRWPLSASARLQQIQKTKEKVTNGNSTRKHVDTEQQRGIQSTRATALESRATRLSAGMRRR
jgi:hypothetical protein